MSISFQDGAHAARLVLVGGTLPSLQRSVVLGNSLGVSYDPQCKQLHFEAFDGHGHRLELDGVDASLFEAEAIAADLLRPLPRGGYRKFTPRRLMPSSFYTGLPADMLAVTMTKITVGRGEHVELPASAYLGVFRTNRRRPEHQLFRLRALIGGLERDTYLDIVVFASDLLLMLTHVGYLRFISLSYGECVVALPRRITELPVPAMVC